MEEIRSEWKRQNEWMSGRKKLSEEDLGGRRRNREEEGEEGGRRRKKEERETNWGPGSTMLVC